MAQPKIDRRAWLATWLQDRRRARHQAGSAPNAPVATSAGFGWNLTQAGKADVWINWTFAHGGFPVASIEVWANPDSGGYLLLGTVASSAVTFYDAMASDSECSFDFKLRYVNGGTLGPFSNVLHLDVSAP